MFLLKFFVVFSVLVFSSSGFADIWADDSCFIATSYQQPADQKQPGLGLQIPAAVTDFIPHRAEYTVQLAKKNQNSQVEDVSGSLTVELKDTGDGWTFEQYSVITITKIDGNKDVYVTKIASWEAKDGQHYRFNIFSILNGQEPESTRGHATIFPGSVGIVDYELPQIGRIKLPVGTMFPLQHLRQALIAASQGQKVFSDKVVFDGSAEIQEAVDVNTVISESQDKIVLSDPTALPSAKAWRLQMAIFPHNSENPEPEYEIEQTALDCGILTHMTMGFAEEGFTAEMILKKVDLFNQPNQKSINTANMQRGS